MLLVFIGGGCGSVCRFGVSTLWRTPSGIPWATLLANITAAFLLGLFCSARIRATIPNDVYLLLTAGFCGGFSTFSTFSLETVQLLRSGQIVLALSNIAFNTLLSLLMVYIGSRW